MNETSPLPAPVASPPRRPSRFRRAWTVGWLTVLAVLLLPAEIVLFLRFVDPPATVMILYKSVQDALEGRDPRWRQRNVARDRVSRHFYQAVVAAEDQRFFDHRGFDLVEIEKARQKHARRPRKPLRGASTLSQQVAKNLFLLPWRSFVRKGAEAYLTLWIELLWPKSRILEVYGNIVELAPGVYGVQAAARHHFRKDAARLTPQEAALLAAVLPNPRRWSASRPTPYIRQRARWVMSQMAPLPKE